MIDRPSEILTFAKAKEHFEKSKVKGKDTKGVKLWGYSRLYRNKNGTFTVKEHPRRGYSYGVTQQRNGAVPLFTVRPDNTYTLHVPGLRNNYGKNVEREGYDELVAKRLARFLPLYQRGYRYYGPRLTAQNPNSGRKPVEPKGIALTEPFYVPPGSYRRDIYQANVKKFGSLDKWYAAYTKDSVKRSKAAERLRQWQHSQTVEIFDGMVLDSKGRVSKRSLERFEATLRKRNRNPKKDYEDEQKRLAAAELERQKAAQEQERIEAEEAYKWLAKFGKEEEVRKANPNTAKYLKHRGLKPTKDGKSVRMVKVVYADLRSYRGKVTYEIGSTIEAADYYPNHNCGQGLHFAPTKEECNHYIHPVIDPQTQQDTNVSLVCEVDLETMRVVDNHSYYGHQPSLKSDKVKAKSCKVLFQGTEADFDKKAPSNKKVVVKGIQKP